MTAVDGWTALVDELRERWAPQPPVPRDPREMWAAVGKQPDVWQLQVTRSIAQQVLLLCSRQAGKSTSMAAAAFNTAVTKPGSTTLIISRSLRQAAELKRKVDEFRFAMQGERVGRTYQRAARRLSARLLREREELDDADAVRDSVLGTEFANGSRILAMPCLADTAVGYTIDLLIYDEAARIPDSVYYLMRQTLARAAAAGRSRLIAASTPNGKRGWFWEEWKNSREAVAAGREPAWECYNVVGGRLGSDGAALVGDCDWLTQRFLQRELESIGKRWYRQEYGTEFVDAVDQVFSEDDIRRALRVVDDGPEQEDV